MRKRRKQMDGLSEFLEWAWARHHNPLSWYVRPLFVLPFCYFAYKKSAAGLVLTVLAVTSSMFWFPAPSEVSSRASAFLAMERQYITGEWDLAKTGMTALVPIWFVLLAWTFWRKSWLAGTLVINAGAALKVVWSFYFGGGTAWSIIPPVVLGALVCNSAILYAFRRSRAKEPSPPLEVQPVASSAVR
jgi:hypothetical protein